MELTVTAPSFTVKSAEEEAAQQARFSEWQDSVLADVGMKRSDFNCFEGVAVEDELVIVWARDIANWDKAPATLVDLGYNGATDRHEYTFMARQEEYAGNAPLLDCLS